MTLRDILDSSDEAIGAGVEWQDELMKITRGLPPRFREALCLLFGQADCITMRSTGWAMGLSEGRVSQIREQAITMLREMLTCS